MEYSRSCTFSQLFFCCCFVLAAFERIHTQLMHTWEGCHCRMRAYTYTNTRRPKTMEESLRIDTADACVLKYSKSLGVCVCALAVHEMKRVQVLWLQWDDECCGERERVVGLRSMRIGGTYAHAAECWVMCSTTNVQWMWSRTCCSIITGFRVCTRNW